MKMIRKNLNLNIIFGKNWRWLKCSSFHGTQDNKSNTSINKKTQETQKIVSKPAIVTHPRPKQFNTVIKHQKVHVIGIS